MIHIKPNDLHSVWHLVRPGLERIIERVQPDWIPEDVYTALRAEASTLHLGYDNEDYDGFLVLTKIPDYCGTVLFVWCAWSNTDCAIEKYLDSLETMARAMGAVKIKFDSPRKGFSKNFKPVTTIYEKEL